MLSTLFFLLYIDDIFKLRLRGYLQLFADDTALAFSYATHQELAEQILRDLDLLYGWFYNTLLSFHLGKTKLMLIQQTGLNVESFHTITVRGVEIERVYSYK